jgi:uncharacterized protein (TIGR02147 family)
MKKPLFSDFRGVLKFELESRNRKNKAYSMRAFSRDLGIAPSRLSEIFAGKQSLSAKRAQTIGQRLGFKEEKLEWFCNLVTAESGRSPHLKEEAQKRIAPFRNGVIAQTLNENLPFDPKWYHFAIRRLTLLSNFKSDPKWISEHLTLSERTVKKAIKEMLIVGMLQLESNGQLTIKENYALPPTPNRKKNSELIFKTMMKKSLESRSKITDQYRHHGLHFFTIDANLIPEIKQIIQEFEDKIDHLTYKSKQHNALYTLLINFFPNSKIEKATTDAKTN